MFCPRLCSFILLLLLLSGCESKPERAPSIGEAYVGPITLNLRKELAPGTPVTATVKHGDKLEIIQHRRRFVKVRTATGAEGWTDGRQLLTPEQMAELRKAASRSSKLPSQGAATVFDALNVHAEPNRQSPSFYQVPEKGEVEVLAHRLMPRNQPGPPPPAEPPRPSKKQKSKEKDREKEKANRIPPPPPPAPPKLPRDWMERSRSALPPELHPAAGETPKEAPPVKLDDWTMVRTKDGKVGWVLTRALTMAIPDEVAQYAEGHRITSYFSLGDVPDGDAVKHNWLWTTISSGGVPWEFDSFRLFIWSLRRHRYETAYIERNVKGYYPIEVQRGVEPSFTLAVEDREGALWRKTYAFNGYRVRLVSKTAIERQAETQSAAAAASAQPLPGPQTETPSFASKIKQKLTGWKQRVFGK